MHAVSRQSPPRDPRHAAPRRCGSRQAGRRSGAQREEASMAQLSVEEQQSATAIVAAIQGAGEADRRGIGDIKDLFCEHWDKVRQILNFLLPYLPAKIKAAVEMIVRIGDWVKGAVCG
jgi:hypothetical protein